MSFRRPDLILDGLRETSNIVIVLIQLMFHSEWGFFSTWTLVALPVSPVFQLASQDYKNGYSRGRFMII